MQEKKWSIKAKNILKSELIKQNIDYQELSNLLSNIGVKLSSSNINSKINRGSFTFIFFLQCMQAINTNEINLDKVKG